MIVVHRLSQAEILRLPECGKFDAEFSKYYPEQRLVGAILATFKSTPIRACVAWCIKYPRCKTFNFLGGDEICELNSKTIREAGVKLEASREWLHADTPVNQTKVYCFLS